MAARLWLLALLGLILALLYMGQPLVALAVMSFGYAGVFFLFDPRRTWWGADAPASASPQPKWPSERRTTLGIAWFVFIGVLIVLVLVLAR